MDIAYIQYTLLLKRVDHDTLSPAFMHPKAPGEVAEWLKAQPWKGCMRVIVSRVRIPSSPPILNFCKIIRGCLGALRLGMVFFRYNPSFLKSKISVRSAMRKFTEQISGKMKFCKPIFFLSPLAKG